MRLPFFRSRPSSVVSRLIATGRVSPAPPPPAQPRELIDVVAVGATETAGDVALTLLSLERYREGHIALFRLFRARGLFELEFPSPHLDLAVTPEAGVPYRFWMMSGGGSGGMREVEYRQSYAIVPAPPSDANEVIIEVRQISWERHHAGTYKVVSVDAGPWRFRIKR